MSHNHKQAFKMAEKRNTAGKGGRDRDEISKLTVTEHMIHIQYQTQSKMHILLLLHRVISGAYHRETAEQYLKF